MGICPYRCLCSWPCPFICPCSCPCRCPCRCPEDKDDATQINIFVPKVNKSTQTDFPPRPKVPEKLMANQYLLNFDEVANGVKFPSNADLENELQFESIVNQVLSEYDSKHNEGQLVTIREPHDDKWEEKYFIHGEQSDIVAEVRSQIHGCYHTSTSEEVDVILIIIRQINQRIDLIIKQRLQLISKTEEAAIQALNIACQKFIAELIKMATDEISLSEIYYQKVLEEFIGILELEMSIYCDGLQKLVGFEKQQILFQSHNYISMISTKAQTAKINLIQSLNATFISQRQMILQSITQIFERRTASFLGYEQLRKLEIGIYSTIGKKFGPGCENIPHKDKYTRDIKQTKSNQPIKRTLYIGTNPTVSIDERTAKK